jgi:hypothetical protein
VLARGAPVAAGRCWTGPFQAGSVPAHAPAPWPDAPPPSPGAARAAPRRAAPPAGVDVAALLARVGLSVSDTSEKVGTFAIAYAAHKALSPVRFPPTVALTPVVAKWLGKKPEGGDTAGGGSSSNGSGGGAAQ